LSDKYHALGRALLLLTILITPSDFCRYRIPNQTNNKKCEQDYSFEEPHWSVYDDVVVLDREEDSYNKKWNVVFAALLGIAVGWGATKHNFFDGLGQRLKLNK